MFLRRLSSRIGCLAILLFVSSLIASQNPSIAFARQVQSNSPGSSLPPIEVKTEAIEVVNIQVTKMDGFST